jgi:hypothetical protein
MELFSSTENYFSNRASINNDLGAHHRMLDFYDVPSDWKILKKSSL